VSLNSRPAETAAYTSNAVCKAAITDALDQRLGYRLPT
jgi:hypothetical protein